MATNVTFNGVTYSIPAAGEVGWSALSSFLISLGNNAAISQEMKQAIRVATTTPVTVSDTTDCVVATNLAVAGAVAVTLPAGTDGRWFVVMDQKGDANTNNITITPNGSETINGSATYVINQAREAVILAYSVTGTRWNVIGRFNSGSMLTNPMTSVGDMIIGTTGGTPVRLPISTGSRVLVSDGTNPLWTTIGNASVSAGAGIVYSKLNLSSSIVDADVSGSAAIAYSKLNLATSIVNADISGSAAIAYSKLNLATSIVNADVSGSAAIAYSKLNLATSIVNADISASAAIAGSKLQAANDTTNAGVVSTGTQTFGGAKTFSSGIVVGGNSTGDANRGTISSVTLSNTYYGTFLLSFTGFATINNQTMQYALDGKSLTLMWPQMQAASGSAAALTSSSGIPSFLRPVQDTNAMCFNRNSGTAQSAVGQVAISASTGIIIFNLTYATGPYAGSGTCGPDAGQVTYRIT